MKKTEEQKAEETRARIEQIRDAVMSHWLRYGRGADVEDIAAKLGVPVSTVRATINTTSRSGRLIEARIPGLVTHEGGSYGRGMGNYPTRWTPDESYLRATLRGEGSGEHEWKVRARIVGRSVFGNGERTYDVIATSESAALSQARAIAEKEHGPLHENSTFRAEWWGRFFVGSKASIEAAIERASPQHPSPDTVEGTMLRILDTHGIHEWRGLVATFERWVPFGKCAVRFTEPGRAEVSTLVDHRDLGVMQ